MALSMVFSYKLSKGNIRELNENTWELQNKMTSLENTYYFPEDILSLEEPVL